MGILWKMKISRPLAHFPDGHSLQASSCGGERFNNIKGNRRQNQFTVVGLQNVEVKNISFRNETLPHLINYGPKARRSHSILLAVMTDSPTNSSNSRRLRCQTWTCLESLAIATFGTNNEHLLRRISFCLALANPHLVKLLRWRFSLSLLFQCFADVVRQRQTGPSNQQKASLFYGPLFVHIRLTSDAFDSNWNRVSISWLYNSIVYLQWWKTCFQWSQVQQDEMVVSQPTWEVEAVCSLLKKEMNAMSPNSYGLDATWFCTAASSTYRWPLHFLYFFFL